MKTKLANYLNEEGKKTKEKQFEEIRHGRVNGFKISKGKISYEPRYYVIKATFRSGDREVSIVRIRQEDERDVKTDLLIADKEFADEYCDDSKVKDFFYDYGDCIIQVDSVREITKKEYDVLNKYA